MITFCLCGSFIIPSFFFIVVSCPISNWTGHTEDVEVRQEINDYLIDQIPVEWLPYNYNKKVYFPAERDPLRLAYLDFIKKNQHKYAPGIVPRRNLK